MQATTLDTTFQALSDPTRRAILGRLRKGEATPQELAAPFKISPPAISRHLKVLEAAGLITRRVAAQRRPCRLNPSAFQEMESWLTPFREVLEQQYQRLDALLAKLNTEGKSHDPESDL